MFTTDSEHFAQELRFKVEIKADGEVRDAEGNLISSEPVTATLELTGSELDALGIARPEHPQE